MTIATVSRYSVLFATALLCAGVATAQMSVESSFPANGGANVSTAVTLTFTFSAPLDTNATFGDDGDFYLNIEVFPDFGEPEAVDLSEDLRTLSADVQLDADTQYWMLLMGARSVSGDTLMAPFTSTFSTAATLPTASISGTASTASGDATGSMIVLFDASSAGESLNDLAIAGATTVAESSGTYTVDSVPPGSYYVMAMRDADHDGHFDEVSGDPISYYDANADGLIDVIDVADGAEITAVDIQTSVASHATASARQSIATTLAGQEASDAVLVQVFGYVDGVTGQSSSWNYVYYAPATADTFSVYVIGNQYALGQFLSENGYDIDMTRPLPDVWIDSDAAVGIADINGLANFISANPDAEMNATLGTLLPNLPNGAANKAGVLGTTAWIVNAWSDTNQEWFSVLIDAVSGEVNPQISSSTEASYNLDAATAEAENWQVDAELVRIYSSGDGVDIFGESRQWIFSYHSPAAGTAREVFVGLGVVENVSDTDPTGYPSLDPLPEEWINSAIATATAESQSNDFRINNQDAYVGATLSRGLRPGDPDRLVWLFDYNSNTNNMQVSVDGTTGQTIVGIEDGEAIGATVDLMQNYPNPFVNGTTIGYKIQETGHASLAVYNLLGQKVKELFVDLHHTAGAYSVRWDGTDGHGTSAASGLYVYRLRTDDATISKSMVLLR